ncbi:zinc finger protein 555-like [Plodia interpunctella]|uniref:zinc finger protein 555-like n=1 Tax=Plodia interpunctella TaxID=58824 RepID=UPI002367F218|nr:zinc finger protein 555-like [Plodia interpunctella]
MEIRGVNVGVDVVRLDAEAINDHLRSSTAVLHDMLRDSSPATTHQFECHECGKVYKNATTLLKHSQLKHPQEKVDVQCSLCEKKYSSEVSLQKHIRYKHQFQCKACYKSFATVDLLNSHAEHCFKNEQPCTICGKVFDCELSLRNHIRYKHPLVKNNWCEICRRAFTTKRGLGNHMATIHPPGTACTLCKDGKNFSSVAALQSHILYKHTENSARCTVCRKVFTSQSSLSRHRLKNHKSFSCDVCLELFDVGADLIRHVLDHHPTYSGAAI